APNVILSGGTLNGVGATVGNLTWNRGTLQGFHTLAGLGSWTGGSLGDGSTLTVASNAVLTISGNTTTYLYGVLTNTGTVNWSGAGSLRLCNNYATTNQTG